MLARKVDGTVLGISINAKPEHERLIDPEGEDITSVVRTKELVMFTKRVSINSQRVQSSHRS